MRAAIAIFATSAAAYAQCAMCRTAAAALQGDSLNHAILILFTPAIFLFTGVFWWAFKRADVPRPLPSRDREGAGLLEPPDAP